MSYLVQAQIAQDSQLIHRVAACAGLERVHGDMAPADWAVAHMLQIAAYAGIADAYQGGAVTGDDGWFPWVGGRPDMVTDDMIRDAVLAISTPPETTSV